MMNIALSVLVCFAVSTGCFGHPLLRARRSVWLREIQEYANATYEVGCSVKVWACPKTPVSVLMYGDPSKGEELIRSGYFTEACRYLKEFKQCAEDQNVMSDPDCVDVRMFTTYVSNQITTICDNPILPIIEELRTCINSHSEELMDFLDRHEAINEQATDEATYCSLYRQLVDDTVALFKACPNTQTLLTAENEATFRKNFYLGVFPKPMPFPCDGR